MVAEAESARPFLLAQSTRASIRTASQVESMLDVPFLFLRCVFLRARVLGRLRRRRSALQGCSREPPLPGREASFQNIVNTSQDIGQSSIRRLHVEVANTTVQTGSIGLTEPIGQGRCRSGQQH
jgi:hypothetical protein